MSLDNALGLLLALLAFGFLIFALLVPERLG
jgi:hypothetical protein